MESKMAGSSSLAISLSTGFKLEERRTSWSGKVFILQSNGHMKMLLREYLGVWGGHGIGFTVWTRCTFPLWVTVMPTMYFSGSSVKPKGKLQRS